MCYDLGVKWDCVNYGVSNMIGFHHIENITVSKGIGHVPETDWLELDFHMEVLVGTEPVTITFYAPTGSEASAKLRAIHDLLQNWSLRPSRGSKDESVAPV